MRKRLALATLSMALLGSVGYQYLSRHEGTRLKSYQDQAGVWTICMGHTKTAKPNQVVSMAVCERLLKQDVSAAEQAVHRQLRPDLLLTAEQYLALVDFVFNLGERAFSTSTLRKRVLAEDCHGAAAEYIRWNKIKINGVYVVSKGLTRRRLEGQELWLSGCV